MSKHKRPSDVTTADLMNVIAQLRANGVKLAPPKGTPEYRSPAVNARSAAAFYLAQFSPTRIHRIFKRFLREHGNGARTMLEWVFRERLRALRDGVDLSPVRLRLLAWVESMIRAIACTHPEVIEALELQALARPLGRDDEPPESPYAKFLRLRTQEGQRTPGRLEGPDEPDCQAE